MASACLIYRHNVNGVLFDNVALVTDFSFCQWSYIPVCLQGHAEKGFGLKRCDLYQFENMCLNSPHPKKSNMR